MKPAVRRTLRICGWSFGALLLPAVVFAGLLAFPGLFFAQKFEYRNYTVHCDGDPGGDMEPILARIDSQLATSEINDATLEHDIFFGHENGPFRAVQGMRAALVERFMGLKPSPNYNASWAPYVNQVVSFDSPDAAHDVLLRAAWPGQVNMTHVLTHELAHTLVVRRLGISGAMNLPFWKTEGYPEYLASSALRAKPDYSLRASVARATSADLAWLRDADGNFQSLRYDCIGRSYLEDENGDSWHTCYYLARLLVEYSLDIRRMRFADLVNPEVRDTEILQALLSDYAAGRL